MKNNKFFIYSNNRNPQYPTCEEQELWIIQMAESQELNIIGTFRDESPNSKQLMQMLQAIKQQDIEGIIVWDISLISMIPLVKRLIKKNKIHAIKPFLDYEYGPK
jgi:hypothetical protein